MMHHGLRRVPFGISPLLAVTILAAGALAGASQDIRDSLRVEREHEIRFPAPLQLPEEVNWVVRGAIAMHPGGERFAVLIPLAPDADTSLESFNPDDPPERNYRLQWVEIGSGETIAQRDFRFPYPAPSVRLTPGGRFLCIPHRDKLLFLDERLETVSELALEFADLKGQPLFVMAYDFFPDGRLFLVLRGSLESGMSKNSAFLVYDWKNGATLLEREYDQAVERAAITGDSTVIVGHRERGFDYYYRLAELSVTQETSKTMWQAHSWEWDDLQLLVTPQHLFWAERQFVCEFCRRLPVRMVSRGFGYQALDEGKYPEKIYFRRSTEPPFPWSSTEVDVRLVGKIRARKRPSGRKGPELRLRDYALHAPLAVSQDERWIVVRASRWDQKRWDVFQTEDRFAIFDLKAPKTARFVSEDFLPSETIMHFAFTPDGSRLVVATSARLLIYRIGR